MVRLEGERKMLNKKGWSALEYLIMTVAVVAALVAGAVTFKDHVKGYVDKVGTQLEESVNTSD